MLGTAIIHDRRFLRLWPRKPWARLLHNHGVFTEGPVWFADHECLLWSDIPANRIRRLAADGSVTVFRLDSNHTNGNSRDRQGRLVSCEHSGRRVTRTEIDGTITVLADSFDGKPLNSPNDVVVKSDGSVWFTDPDYGLRLHVPGGIKHQAGDFVFRIDPVSGAVTVVARDFDKPNGLAFSPDEQTLYIADSAITDGPGRNSHIRRFDVEADGTLSGGEVFATTLGTPDGMRVDVEGNVWTSAGPKIDVYAPSGTLLGQIVDFPANVTNLTFGGRDRDRIFVTAGASLFAIGVAVSGAQTP
ncbi:MAG: SMP-30/gluconolactonase/LRE family protein [Devosia sp.]